MLCLAEMQLSGQSGTAPKSRWRRRRSAGTQPIGHEGTGLSACNIQIVASLTAAAVVIVATVVVIVATVVVIVATVVVIEALSAISWTLAVSFIVIAPWSS